MQGEEERQQQRGQPLVIQSEQEPVNAQAAHDVQNQIGKMIDERLRPAHQRVEHEADRLKGAVKGAVGPQKRVGSEGQLDLRQVADDEIALFEDFHVIEADEVKARRREVNG